MKSFCIKNNNNKILNYLLMELQSINVPNVYVSQNKFKFYNNVIVHYTGQKVEEFITMLSKVLMNCIIQFYEPIAIKKIISSDYFYFNDLDRKTILNNCYEILEYGDAKEFEFRKEKVFISLVEYIKNNKFFILDGFVNFRLYEYNNLLSEVVDIAVNKHIIDTEYKEFVKLLQDFIETQPARNNMVHLIYSNLEPILLDENQNIIQYDSRFIQPKYLSDISFSSNDYCLNELLNLLPQKLILHLLVEPDEFTNTLQLIFRNRIIVCKECNICKTFEMLSANVPMGT